MLWNGLYTGPVYRQPFLTGMVDFVAKVSGSGIIVHMTTHESLKMIRFSKVQSYVLGGVYALALVVLALDLLVWRAV